MKKEIVGPRKDVIEWEDYFMVITKLVALRSKDPHHQVGSIIVDKKLRIVGTGYNGLPRGLQNEDFPWNREGSFSDTKYAYVVHAEQNAILNSFVESLEDCTIYSTLMTCEKCVKMIIQSGIKKIIFSEYNYREKEQNKAAEKMLASAGIEVVHKEKISEDVIKKINLF